MEWEPYGSGDEFGVVLDYALNPKCLEERRLWLMRCPLICNWAVEYHLPHRVMRQFGLFQAHPAEWVDTDQSLHRLETMKCVFLLLRGDTDSVFLTCSLDRKRQRKVKKWDVHHKKYVIEFETCVERAKESGWGRQKAHCPVAFNNYIRWFLRSTRVEICPSAFEEEILEEPTVFDELAQSQYNRMVRQGNQTPFF